MSIGKKTVKIMLLITVLVSLATGVFRGIILLNYIDSETGFYVRGTATEVVFNVIMAAIFVGIFACGFLTRKAKTPEYLDSRSMVVVFTSSLCAFMYLLVCIYGLYTIAAGLLAANAETQIMKAQGYFVDSRGFLFTLTNIAPSITSNGVLFAVQMLLCPLCFMNHITICSKEIREKNKAHSIFAMAETLFFAIRVVEIFMNVKSQINTSQRSLELLMLCAMMLFFLFEAGFLVKRIEGNNSVSKYIMSALATVSLPLIALLPYTTVSLFFALYDANFVVMDVLECCIMLFAASRLLTINENN